MMPDMSSYQISVSDEQINDLKRRLELAKFPDELDEAGWGLWQSTGQCEKTNSFLKKTIWIGETQRNS